MGVKHCLGNRQTEAETAEPAGDRALALLERIEDPVHLLGLDADTRIRCPDFDQVRRRVQCLDDDPAFRGREFHAVFDQVPEHLLQSRRIAFHVSPLGAEAELDL